MYIVAGVSVSFLFKTESYSIEWIDCSLFIYSSIHGHWGCFPFLATVTSADRLIMPVFMSYVKRVIQYVFFWFHFHSTSNF